MNPYTYPHPQPNFQQYPPAIPGSMPHGQPGGLPVYPGVNPPHQIPSGFPAVPPMLMHQAGMHLPSGIPLPPPPMHPSMFPPHPQFAAPFMPGMPNPMMSGGHIGMLNC